MTDEETDDRASPFWRFSLGFYRQPGVADACIALQDGCGVDVNILLFFLWLATMRRCVSPEVAQEVCGKATPWRDLRLRELAPFAVLLIVVVWIGVAPGSLIDKVQDVASSTPRSALAHPLPQAALAATRSEHAR